MNVLRYLLTALCLAVFSTNATAIMIDGEPHAMDLSMEDVRSLLDDYDAEGKKEAKALKKAKKKLAKLYAVHNKMESADPGKLRKLAKKMQRKEKRLQKALSKLDGLDLTAFLAAAEGPTPGPADTTPDGQDGLPQGGGGDIRGVPEPSSIVLLGIGLAGFAAARRFRKAA